MRILIVEDEVRLAEALAQIMAEQKYQVDQVHNGADGLDVFNVPSVASFSSIVFVHSPPSTMSSSWM